MSVLYLLPHSVPSEYSLGYNLFFTSNQQSEYEDFILKLQIKLKKVWKIISNRTLVMVVFHAFLVEHSKTF